MRYLATVRAWREGEFEAEYKALEAEAAEKGIHFSRDEEFDRIYAKRTREIVIEAKDISEAGEMAKRMAVDAGLPPVREWAELSSVSLAPIPYITLRELLSAPVVESEHDSLGWAWVLQGAVDTYRISDRIGKEKRVRTDYYGHECFDGRRGWALGAVFFDGELVFVFQAAGRENRDHRDSFLVSVDRYEALITYLRSIAEERPREFGLDEEILHLSHFYSTSLTDLKPRTPV